MCIDRDNCHWIVAKGCKKNPPELQKKMKEPTPVKEASPIPKPVKKVKVTKKKAIVVKVPSPVKIKTPSPVKMNTPVKEHSPIPKPVKKVKVTKKKVAIVVKAPSPVKINTPSPVKIKTPSPKVLSAPMGIPPAHEKEPWDPKIYGSRKGDDNFWYGVNYSNNNMSKCQQCKEKILKNELRVSRYESNPFSDGDLIKNFHAEHAFDAFITARCSSAPITWEKLYGTKELTDGDRGYIFNKIKAFNLAWEKKCKNKMPKKA